MRNRIHTGSLTRRPNANVLDASAVTAEVGGSLGRPTANHPTPKQAPTGGAPVGAPAPRADRAAPVAGRDRLIPDDRAPWRMRRSGGTADGTFADPNWLGHLKGGRRRGGGAPVPHCNVAATTPP